MIKNNLRTRKKTKRHLLPGLKALLAIQKNRYVLVGIVGVVLAFAGGASLYAVSLPWRGTADSFVHLDYAWQLSHGDLPAFWEGVKAKLPARVPVQFVSQHPPLYYVIIAPFVGPLVDSGHWKIAVALARSVTIVMGLLCVGVFCMGWLGLWR